MTNDLTPEEQQFQANIVNQLNGRWGELLGQTLIKIEQLEFRISQQAIEIQEMAKFEISLTDTIEDLKARLHQADCEIVSMRTQAIIADVSVDVQK